VKDLPAACPERCFTSFSMTGMERRGRSSSLINFFTFSESISGKVVA